MTYTDTDTDTDQLRAALLTLTPGQATAAEALATGSTHAEAAELANVARETVTRWAGHHPAFRAALDLYRTTLATETADRARRLRRKALDAAEAALEAGTLDPLALLRAVPEPTGQAHRPHSAAELLDLDAARIRLNLPPKPYNPLADDYLTDPDGSAYLARIAAQRLADAAGITTEDTDR